MVLKLENSFVRRGWFRAAGMLTAGTLAAGMLFAGAARAGVEAHVSQPAVRALTFNVWALPDLKLPFLKYEPAPDRDLRIELLCERLRQVAHRPVGWDVIFIQELWVNGSRDRLKDCGYPYWVDLEDRSRTLIEIVNEAIEKSWPGPGLYETDIERWLSEALLPDRYVERKLDSSMDAGLMILSRFPVSNAWRVVLPRPDTVAGGDGIEYKSVVFAKVHGHPAGTFWVANTHLAANYDDDHDELLIYRWRQFEALVAAARRITRGFTEPLILGGDFNFGPEKEEGRPENPLWSLLPSRLPGFVLPPEHAAVERTYRARPDENLRYNHVDHIFGSCHFEAVSGRLVFDEPEPVLLADHAGWETVFRPVADGGSVGPRLCQQ